MNSSAIHQRCYACGTYVDGVAARVAALHDCRATNAPISSRFVAAPADELPVELDFRAGDGIAVSLLWRRRTNRLSVLVSDERSHEEMELDVGGGSALDVFNHPFANAA